MEVASTARSGPGTAERGLEQAVVITAWGRREYLEGAIDSVGSSEAPPEELAVIANFRDARLERRVVERGGQWLDCAEDRFGRMVAEGVRATSAPLVSFLDDDDVYLPGRLARARREFARDPSLGFLHVGGAPFLAGGAPPVAAPSPRIAPVSVGPGERRRSDFASIWSRDAAYNGSSVTLRREVIGPYLGDLGRIRLAVPPYLFYRAWVSPWGLRAVPDVLVGIGQHAGSSTTGSLQPRSVRLPRLRRISTALADDARAIHEFLPAGTWDFSLREMVAMATIFASLDDATATRATLAGALRDLARRRTVWVPRGALVMLALARGISPTVARGTYRWLTES